MIIIFFLLILFQNCRAMEAEEDVEMKRVEEYFILKRTPSGSSPTSSCSSFSSDQSPKLSKSVSAPTSPVSSASSYADSPSLRRSNSAPGSPLFKSNSAPSDPSLKNKSELCPMCYKSKKFQISKIETSQCQTIALIEALRNKKIVFENGLVVYPSNVTKQVYKEHIRETRQRLKKIYEDTKIYPSQNIIEILIQKRNPIFDGHDKNSCKLLSKARFGRFVENFDLFDSLDSLNKAKDDIGETIVQFNTQENCEAISFIDMMREEIVEVNNLMADLFDFCSKHNFSQDTVLRYCREKILLHRKELFDFLNDDEKFIQVLREPLFLTDIIKKEQTKKE